MAFLRPLHQTISEFVDDASSQMPLADLPGSVRVTSFEFSVPIVMQIGSGDADLLGDLPLFRRRTEFDPEPARLTITLAEVAS